MQFATNHLGHFALATGLHGALAAAGGARVVSVSSSAHLRSPVVFEDIHFHERAYEPWAAYGQSKTANVLFGVEATKRWADDGITVNALMPGAIRTNLQRHITDEELERLRAQSIGGAMRWKTPEQGAATSVLVATSPLLDGIGGRYFEDCNEAAPNEPGSRSGVAPTPSTPKRPSGCGGCPSRRSPRSRTFRPPDPGAAPGSGGVRRPRRRRAPCPEPAAATERRGCRPTGTPPAHPRRA